MLEMKIELASHLQNKSKKSGRLNTSHRYNRLSLLPSDPGEVQQELVV
jgi:hypothetical protein